MALPEFIRREPESIIAIDAAFASSHLSRYVRSAVENLGDNRRSAISKS
jgi:hypothetical protein